MYKLILPLFIACSFFQCNPEPDPNTGTLELIFKSSFNGSPLVLYQKDSTNVSDPTTITFKKLDFFVSDIKIQDSSNEWQYIKDAGYVSMANNLSLDAASEGYSMTINEVPIGDYEGLEIGIGLSDQVNATLPGDYSSSSPLGLNAKLFGLAGTVISCARLREISNNLMLVFRVFCTTQVLMVCIKSEIIPQVLVLGSNANTQIVFEIKAEELFFKTGSSIDLINDNQTHSGQSGSDAYNLALKAIQNLSNSIYIP